MIYMETTTNPQPHWTQFPAGSDVIRTVECDPWDVEYDGQIVPAGAFVMLEDFYFVGWTRDENAAKVWADALPEDAYDRQIGHNGFDGNLQQGEYV